MTDVLNGLAAFIWVLTALLPWQPWRSRELLDADSLETLDLSDITVIIPARDEADVIGATLQALKQQGQGLHIILVDDESTDGTADIARKVELENLQIIRSEPLPSGWTGKLWAQEQGLQVVQTSLVLLLDADILLKPGLVSALKAKRAGSRYFCESLFWVSQPKQAAKT
jgi:glycosyltransferase involved in cell wall biosynthesis